MTDATFEEAFKQKYGFALEFGNLSDDEEQDLAKGVLTCIAESLQPTHDDEEKSVDNVN